MAIELNTCCSTITLPDFKTPPPSIPPATVWSIQYKIGATNLTGNIFFFTTVPSEAQVQVAIDADPTFVAYKLANPGTTITVRAGSISTTGLTVDICKPAMSQITDLAEGIFQIIQS